MPSVSVLYISDEIVGPHLELLRNICEPFSKSRPHVTVRYFDKLAIPEDHLKTKVTHIDLLEPGSFGLDQGDNQENKTIYIRCQSDELLLLEHKPLFPTSEFHITLYDGHSESFAKSLLELLREFHWAMRVSLPSNSSLTKIQIKPKQRNRPIPPLTREYRPELRELFTEITGEKLTYDFVLCIPSTTRLKFAKQICQHLEQSSKVYPRIQFQPTDYSPSSLDHFASDNHEVHLTPPELAQAITEYAIKFLDQKNGIDFGDPSVGTGAFYAALLKSVSKERIASAIGIDISPKQVEAAKWRWANKDMTVIEGDYLHMEKLPLRNLILANPPYMRHQGIPTDYKLELRQRSSVIMGMKISGLSGQYVYFMLLSHQWMADNAVAAWLIPSEFMQTSYGAALRFYLTHKVSLIRIHQFGHEDPQFENAEVLPCVVVFKNSLPNPDHTALLTSGGTLSSPSISEAVKIEELKTDLKWSIPRRSVLRGHRDSATRIKDLFSVRRGIATGANDFFILEREKAIALGIPSIALKPILPKVRNLKTDIIERCEDGFPNIDQQLCLLDIDLPEEEISRRYPRLMDYLNTGKDQELLNRYLVKKRPHWYKQEQRKPAPFLCTYMGRAHENKPAIRFIWNKSNAIATNTYLMLYPNPNLSKLMNENDNISSIIFELLKESSLSSVEKFSRTHAGGLTKIEPRELLEVWLPPLPEVLHSAVDTALI